MNTTTMMQLVLCFMVMFVVVNVQAATTIAAPAATAAPAPTTAPGGTTAAPGGGEGIAATFTGSGYITLIASVIALLYQLL